jgi:hypothetical protein
MKRIAKWSVPRLALGAVLSIAAVSAAFFLVTTFVSSGEHSGKTGAAAKENHALPMTVSFPESELTPSHPVPLSIMVENNSGQTATVSGPVVTIETPGDPICGAQWLEVMPEDNSGEADAVFAAKLAGTDTKPLKPIPAGGGPKNILQFFEHVEGTSELNRLMLQFKPADNAINETQCAEQTVIVKATLGAPS